MPIRRILLVVALAAVLLSLWQMSMQATGPNASGTERVEPTADETLPRSGVRAGGRDPVVALDPAPAGFLRFVDGASGAPLVGVELRAGAGPSSQHFEPDTLLEPVAISNHQGLAPLPDGRSIDRFWCRADGYEARATGALQSGDVVALAATRSALVVVLDTAGRPIPDVIVATSAVPLDFQFSTLTGSGGEAAPGPDGVSFCRTDSNGVARLDGLRQGSVVLDTYKYGFGLVDRPPVESVVPGSTPTLEFILEEALYVALEVPAGRPVTLSLDWDSRDWAHDGSQSLGVRSQTRDLKAKFEKAQIIAAVPKRDDVERRLSVQVLEPGRPAVVVQAVLVPASDVVPVDLEARVPFVALDRESSSIVIRNGKGGGTLARSVGLQSTTGVSVHAIADGTEFTAQPGFYAVTSRNPWLRTELTDVELSLPGHHEIVLDTPLIPCELKVTNAAGRPVTHFALGLNAAAGGIAMNVVHRGGTAELDLPKGRVSFRMMAAGYRPLVVETDVSETGDGTRWPIQLQLEAER